jgi:hypothetical protein
VSRRSYGTISNLGHPERALSANEGPLHGSCSLKLWPIVSRQLYDFLEYFPDVVRHEPQKHQSQHHRPKHKVPG